MTGPGLPRVDDETLAAYVDGELSPEKAAAVAMLLADDPEAQARLDALFETGRLLAAAYAAPMAEPVPERLLALVEGRPERAAPPAAGGARVIAFPRRARLPAAIGLALAASVALFIGVQAPTDAPFHVAAGPAATDGRCTPRWKPRRAEPPSPPPAAWR
jgi:anti-sigma factor RsiW